MTLSTFRTAAKFCEQFEGFIFNHNEALLYQWIEEHEPSLFERIRQLVKAGKWNIIGGWYLQPDCNMPSGESFVRQILVGKNYFIKKFGVNVTTAVNFDPFGHTRGLVQILAKSGYDSYLFCRPAQQALELPAENFVWVGLDGSKITAARKADLYVTAYGKACEKIENLLIDNPDTKPGLILWGVGDHGGGASKIDLKNIDKLIKKRKDFNITHSSPQAYFRELKKQKLSEYSKSLHHCCRGCYTSMMRVKRLYRELENDLFVAEKMACAATYQGLIKYPERKIHEATYDLLFTQFHDAITGTSVQPVENCLLNRLGHGLEITSGIKAKAFFALSQGQSKEKNNQISILIYNPHPFPIRQIVECEFSLPEINFSGKFTDVKVFCKKRIIPCQLETQLCNISLEHRKRVAFLADLKPSQINRFDCKLRLIDKKPRLRFKGGRNNIDFKTKDLRVVINKKTGLIDKYHAKGKSLIAPKAFEAVVLNDSDDSWQIGKTALTGLADKFRLMSREAAKKFSGIEQGRPDSVRVIEDGPARTIIEALFSYNKSCICQRYKLPKFGTEIELEMRVYWNEKGRMLKLAIPLAARDTKVIAQTAYGLENYGDISDEHVGQKWIAATSKSKNLAITCINDCTYGFDLADNVLRPTLLRSPSYCGGHFSGCAYITPQDRFTAGQDQGEHIFRFWINMGSISRQLERIDRLALVRNEKPYALSYNPPGMAKKIKPLAILSDDVVQITAIKKAENNKDMIIRLFNPTDKFRAAILSLPLLQKKFKVKLSAFEIKTLRVNQRKRIKETDLMEK